MANTQSKVDTLEEQNSKLIAEIAELRKENARLKQIIEENEKRDVRVEELEQKNIELETRLAILEQGKEEKSISIAEQAVRRSSESWLFEPTEDVSHSPIKSNDTLKQIVLQCGDTPVSDITDDTSEQAVLQNKDAPASDVSNNVSNSDKYQSQVSDSSLTIPPICVKSKSSEGKRIDNFLNEKHNEQICNEIRERNREKKLLQNNETSASQAQNSYSDSSPKSHDELHVKQISESQSIPNTPNLPEESSEQNTDLQKTKIPEIDVQPLIEELRIEPLVEDTIKVVNVDKNSTDKQSLAIELVHLFEKISLAENNTKRAKVEEITSWYQYRKHFEKRLDDILPENQRNDKRAYDLASGQIYDEMLQYLSGISRVSLRKRTQRTKPIYKLFSVIGGDKIKRIKTYSANKLSKLTDVQIDTIKKHFIAIPRDQKSRTHMTEVSISPNNILPENKIHDHAYFRNKTLLRYSDLYKVFISEKFDRYGIIEGLICPVCKLDHEDGKSVKGKYEAGSYFIICGKREIEITA